jgi:hypothetical protein
VNDADNPQRLRVSVDDEIGMERPEQKITLGEVLTFVADAGGFGKLPKRAVELFKQTIGGGVTVFRNEFPDLLKVPKSDGPVRTDSRLASAALSTEGTKLAKGLFAVDGVTPVDIVEPFTDHAVDFLGSVFLAQIARYHEMVDGFVQELAGVG